MTVTHWPVKPCHSSGEASHSFMCHLINTIAIPRRQHKKFTSKNVQLYAASSGSDLSRIQLLLENPGFTKAGRTEKHERGVSKSESESWRKNIHDIVYRGYSATSGTCPYVFGITI